MNNSDRIPPALEPEVRAWVAQLLYEAGGDRLRAASELSRLGIAARGSVLTRGYLTAAADDRLQEPELQDMAELLATTSDKDLRCQIALALGEWGGPDAAAALRRLLQSEKDREVRLHYITALRTVGGPDALEGLREVIESDTDDVVRNAVISAIEELATGGRTQDTEATLRPRPHIAATDRPKRVPRVSDLGPTLGGAPPMVAGDVIRDTVDTLRRVRNDSATSKLLRFRADEVLAHLND
jgi:hypothetical protein